MSHIREGIVEQPIESYVLVTGTAEQSFGLRLTFATSGAITATRFSHGNSTAITIPPDQAQLFTTTLWALGILSAPRQPSPTASDSIPNTDPALA